MRGIDCTSYCAQTIATRKIWTCGIAIDRWFFVIRQNTTHKSAHIHTNTLSISHWIAFINTLTCLCFHSIILPSFSFEPKIFVVFLTLETSKKKKYLLYYLKKCKINFSVCRVEWWQKVIFSFQFDTKKISLFLVSLRVSAISLSPSKIHRNYISNSHWIYCARLQISHRCRVERKRVFVSTFTTIHSAFIEWQDNKGLFKPVNRRKIDWIDQKWTFRGENYLLIFQVWDN